MNSAGKHTQSNYFIKLLRACAVVNSIFIVILCIAVAIVACMITADDGRGSSDASMMRKKQVCWTQLALPMPQEVTTDLCDRDLVPKEVADCSITPPQLQWDDTEAIIRANVTIGTSTHQSVKEDFGNYEMSCSEIKQINNLYWCTYNLSGEGPEITILYNASTQIVDDFQVLQDEC